MKKTGKTGKKKSSPYLHGFSPEEQERLWYQAELLEYTVFERIDFSGVKNLLEIGSGTGAQTAILLRRFPKLHVTGIELNERQIEAARQKLSQLSYGTGRYDFKNMDAGALEFDEPRFDGAFLCWVLEHVKDPPRILSEARRVLAPGSPIYVSEVMNSSFFLDPYSPNIWKYWMSFNDFQFEKAGDPFIGAKLGNLLLSQGFQNIRTEVKSWLLDNRSPLKRKQSIRYWKDLLLSASDNLLSNGVVDKETVAAMKAEFSQVENDPDAVIFYAFIQATATT